MLEVSDKQNHNGIVPKAGTNNDRYDKFLALTHSPGQRAL